MTGTWHPIRPKPEAKLSAPDAFPPDLLVVDGLLADFMAECDRSAPARRQPVYALAAAICTVGVLAGRRYRSPTNLRTNIYAAILGGSSSGKGHCQKVTKRLLIDAELSHYVGGDYQSGNALATELVEHPARLQLVDEFGIWLAGLTSDRAPKHLVDIKRRLMTLFSDAGDVVAGTAYADARERARHDIHEPHLCLLGAGTPDHVFAALQSGALRDGFIPRILFFKPDVIFPERVKDPQPMEISGAMIDAARAIAGVASGEGNLGGMVRMSAQNAGVVQTVQFTADGRAEHDRFEDIKEAIVQGGFVGFCSPELVGKWGEHAVKLALIRAISRDPREPVMDAECVGWGWRVAEHCIRTVNSMAERHIADNETERLNKRVRSIIQDAGPAGLTTRELTPLTRFVDARQRGVILTSLIEGGEVVAEPLPVTSKGGRPGNRYRAVTG